MTKEQKIKFLQEELSKLKRAVKLANKTIEDYLRIESVFFEWKPISKAPKDTIILLASKKEQAFGLIPSDSEINFSVQLYSQLSGFKSYVDMKGNVKYEWPIEECQKGQFLTKHDFKSWTYALPIKR